MLNSARLSTANISRIASLVATPFYCYDQTIIHQAYSDFSEALTGLKSNICYAIKASPNINLLKIMAGLGAGADAVSEGEMRRALLAGIDPQKIVFSGVGKTHQEIIFALRHKILQINIESAEELLEIEEIAKQMNLVANIAIRVNPEVDAATHNKITTGRKEDKFGIDISIAPDLYFYTAKSPFLNPVGVAVHIGSQITSLEPFHEAFLKVRDFYNHLVSNGILLKYIDLGGGLGIKYHKETPPKFQEYGELVKNIFANEKDNVEFIFEPGRCLIAEAGTLISKVIRIKKTTDKTFAIIDCAMNDLARPALYDSYHEVTAISSDGSEMKNYDIVGPVCETTDCFAKNRLLSTSLMTGDLLMIHDSGAYGASMANQYNSRPLVAEVLIDCDGEYHIIRRRPSYERMFELESVL